ncbi:TPA: iron-sulfur cluster assembly scaffold protein [candidate division WWE3 bacterium]|uniref:Iron-sulfur cluster assembly scaffold protein n=1 Tax=candidate division WWE3 bacterium TaxID=2053526 RepID=A0A656PNA1_UNCKA|nr:NifU family SUF system FeS assembly protein [candidate division WWE3 bacterium RAAC2_WWE3_1]KKS54779.1 MAG: NifU family SUF system FeS assembly protein [candidate division WWE3 bacterium GW2011_GWD2_42_34]KKT08458.1 MAG: NifU family SUF system FeS assembly protein [candidate division WWE3 bacterium GW2011_GWD1_43_201]KKT10372.1 MAG: NifU family SUF system FeS assembly protein [candidate division WWE3 bacterium GW2011_GWA2_43_24]OGC68382.1 MAG: hypothetical protein A2364_00185 [candidate divi
MDNIYQEELMDIYKNPAKRGLLDGADVSISQSNPMCGDDVSVQLKIENGIVKDARFHGNACMVSIVSSEILLDYLVGKTLDEVKVVTKEKFLEMLNLNLSTSRIGCATLALGAVQKAVNEYEKK